VFIDDTVYLFSEVRNFVWKHPHQAKKQYLDFCVRKKDIVGCDLYLDRFGWRNLAGHIILEFRFTSGEKLALSVEARLADGEEYSFWKGLLLQYPLVAIWGTSEDILGLRRVRKDALVHYELRIQKRNLQLFFEKVLRATDYVNTHFVRYNLLLNNCTSLLWRVVSETFGIAFRHWQIFLPGYVDRLLYKLGLISRKEYYHPEMMEGEG
jgi:hypothetical protein